MIAVTVWHGSPATGLNEALEIARTLFRDRRSSWRCAAAFLAPYVIDWGSYRWPIEKYGSKLTGRQVTVAGEISGRLFPWPKLTIRDVQIANPPAPSPDFISAEEVDVRMTLAGLFGGEIRVESIDIVRPVVAFERMANGQGSWHLEARSPSAGKPRFSTASGSIKFAVSDGVVHLIDNRGRAGPPITVANATLRGRQNFAGPWRMRADRQLSRPAGRGRINTGSWTPDAPFKFGFRIRPGDGSGLVYQFDGANDGNHVTGNLQGAAGRAASMAEAMPKASSGLWT